jgi:hypothetical protein
MRRIHALAELAEPVDVWVHLGDEFWGQPRILGEVHTTARLDDQPV